MRGAPEESPTKLADTRAEVWPRFAHGGAVSRHGRAECYVGSSPKPPNPRPSWIPGQSQRSAEMGSILAARRAGK
jgi:hypothetical protein